MEVIGISIDLSWETTLKINSLSHPWSDFTTSITTYTFKQNPHTNNSLFYYHLEVFMSD